MTSPALPVVQTFMTHRMSDAAIRMLATGRESETQQVMDAVARSLKAAPGALQHVVIYGPRGFGKSFMARLVQIETASLATPEAPIPFVLLPEEQQNLTRNPHALPAYIAHRIADLRTGEDHSWTEDMFQWPDPDKAARQWEEATATLEQELKRSLPQGKGMAIVVIENFDALLASVFKEEAAEQRLRKWLDSANNQIMLIATATGSVDMDYNRPLFQAFQSIRLEPWPPETCLAYFNRRREAEAKPSLDPAMEAKALAVADFIGGNPRLAQLLAEVLETQDALSVAGTMNALADKLADYYRRRIDDLPALAQGLLDALIRGGEPASQTELARRVGADGQHTIARVMQDLQRSDIIRGLPAPDSRETLYRVTDRVFVHFYRLRQGNQLTLKTPLATILDFLRAFYSRDEQKTQALQHLDAGRPAEARVFADLAREGGAAAKGARSAYVLGFGKRLQRIAKCSAEALPKPAEDILRDMETCPEGLLDALNKWKPATPLAKAARAIIGAQAWLHMGLEEQADHRLGQTLDDNQDAASQVLLHIERASLLEDVRGDDDGASRHFSLAGDANITELPKCLQSVAFRYRARALGESGRHEEALVAARNAAAVADKEGNLEDQAIALRLVAWSLGQLGRHEEAVATAREAAALAAKEKALVGQAIALRYAAWSLGQLGRHEEAISSARNAAALADKGGDLAEHATALRCAACSLDQLDRHEEVIATAHAAADLADIVGNSQEKAAALQLAAGSLYHTGEHQKALADALSALAVSESPRNPQNMSLAYMYAIEAAAHVSSPEALTAFTHWAARNTTIQQGAEKPSWIYWLDNGFAAAARARNWTAIDQLIEEQAERLADVYLDGSRIGAAIARTAAAEGRAAGFEAARGTLPRIGRIYGLTKNGVGRLWQTIVDLVSAFAKNCRDPGLIRDVAGLLTADLSPEAPGQATLLLALAQVDEADEPLAVLARMDPDVALWVRRLRDLPEPAEKPRRRKTRNT